MPAAEVEAKAIRALRDFLLLNLPARCTTVNATRAAVLKAPRAGPYTIASGAELRIGIEPEPVADAITAGTRTAAEVAADLSGLVGVTASADTEGRLVLTATAAPSEATPSCVYLGRDETGANAAFGWDAGGEQEVRSAVVAPTHRGVSDGWPVDGLAAMGAGFYVILGDRSSQPRGEHRDDTYNVTVDLAVVRAEPLGAPPREGLQAAVRCVREAILSQRTLGDSVFCAWEQQCRVYSRPFRFEDGGPLYDAAEMRWRFEVYEVFP